MSIDNVLASVAVKDLKVAIVWYDQLFGRPWSRAQRHITIAVRRTGDLLAQPGALAPRWRP